MFIGSHGNQHNPEVIFCISITVCLRRINISSRTPTINFFCSFLLRVKVQTCAVVWPKHKRLDERTVGALVQQNDTSITHTIFEIYGSFTVKGQGWRGCNIARKYFYHKWWSQRVGEPLGQQSHNTFWIHNYCCFENMASYVYFCAKGQSSKHCQTMVKHFHEPQCCQFTRGKLAEQNDEMRT